MKIGPYTLTAIETGYLSLDGGAMFGTVPKILWEKQQPADEKNRIRLAMRALLIEGEGRRILVDCGLGDKGDARFREMFAVDQSTHSLRASLAARGLSTDDITDVVLTHLHFDHAGAATTKDAHEGSYLPTFANATYHLQEKNLATAKAPNARERASYLPEIYRALVDQKRLRLAKGNETLFPGIELWVSNGHTEAQQHVVVTDHETSLFYGGDLIPMTSHVPLPWIMGYDLRPLVMLEEKERLLSRMKQERWVLFYEHDPLVQASTVVDGKRDFAPGEAVDISS